LIISCISCIFAGYSFQTVSLRECIYYVLLCLTSWGHFW